MTGILADLDAALAIRPRAVAADLIGHVAEGGTEIAIAEREDAVEMHGGAVLRHQAANHPRGGALREEPRCDLEDRLACRALPHPDEDDAFADRHHVPPFERGGAERLVG